MTLNIFITFDFGMKGDYEGLYKWLDENNAEERGYGVARITNLKIEPTVNTDIDLLRYMRTLLKEKVNIGNSDRIYIIWKSLEKNTTASAFVFGKKKQSPWEGFAQKNDDQLDLEI